MIIIFEKILAQIRIKIKIIYLKLKYGKRIKIGKNLKFRKNFNIIIEKDGFLEIGDNNFFNNDCSINCLKNIKIGDDNIFGENITIYDHNHIFNETEEALKKQFSVSKIIIGNNNWIGSNVTILKNARIQNRNVIGAGIILNKEIDSNNLLKNSENYIIEKINFK